MQSNLHKYSQAFCHAAAEECTRVTTAWLDGQASDQELLDTSMRIARQIDGFREEEVEGYSARSANVAEEANRAYRSLLEAFRRATAARSAVVVLNTVRVGADDAGSLRRATFRRIISQQGVLPWGSAPIPRP